MMKLKPLLEFCCLLRGWRGFRLNAEWPDTPYVEK